jgi:hypothetical protein
MTIEQNDLLELLKTQIENRLNWGQSVDWTTQDFERLSGLIFDKTTVRLSVSTLKRLWGKVKYDSAPAITTLNTLAEFLGYTDWRSFTVEYSREDIAPVSVLSGETAAKKNKSKKYWVPLLIIGTTVIAIGLFTIFSFDHPPKPIDKTKVSFTARAVSNDLPNTVVFSYKTNTDPSDTVAIQQSWDRRRRETVPGGEQKYTSIYYSPGLHKAKLLINNEIAKEIDVWIKTNGWQGVIDQEPIPLYLTGKDINLQGNSMEIPVSLLESKTGKSIFNDKWTRFSNIGNIPRPRKDSFTVNATLQNTSTREQSACRRIRIWLFSTDAFISIPLYTMGCASKISVVLDKVYISGKTNDLSAFGCDFSKPQSIRCEVAGKKVAVFLNKKPIFSNTLQKLPGTFMGLTISFEGAGQAKDVTFY